MPSRPGVGVATAVLEDHARAFGQDTRIDGVDPGTIAQTYRFQWKRGSEAVLHNLDSTGAVVKKSYADSHHLAIGSRFSMTTAGGRVA